MPVCGWIVESKSKKSFKIDLFLAAVVFTLYLLNKSQGIFYWLPSAFGHNHMNDLLAGVLFPAYLNLTMYFSSFDVRIRRVPHVFLIAFVCCVVWEGIYPLVNTSSTADLQDCLCYFCGSWLYSKLTKLAERLSIFDL